MKKLSFCPNCGKEKLTFIEDKKWQCNNCNFTLFHNIAAAVAVIIRTGNDIYLTERGIEPMLGYLDLPGGFSDKNENAEETCKRELSEELGISFHNEKFSYIGSQPNIYPYKGIVYHTMDLFFELLLKEKFSPNIDYNEIKNGLWININNIPLEKIAFESQRKMLKQYIKNNRLE